MSPSLARSFAVAAAALLLLLCCSSSAATAESSVPPAAPRSDPLEDAVEAVKAGDIANILTFTPEQISAAEGALNSTAAAVFAAVNATKTAKAQFFQDAIATPFGQLKAGGLRAGGLVKRTNRTTEWLSSELALAPFARAFSQVSAAVESSPVGKAFAASTREAPTPGSTTTAEGEGSSSGEEEEPKFPAALPNPRQVLAKVSDELRLPGGGPAEHLSSLVVAGAGKGN